MVIRAALAASRSSGHEPESRYAAERDPFAPWLERGRHQGAWGVRAELFRKIGWRPLFCAINSTGSECRWQRSLGYRYDGQLCFQTHSDAYNGATLIEFLRRLRHHFPGQQASWSGTACLPRRRDKNLLGATRGMAVGGDAAWLCTGTELEGEER